MALFRLHLPPYASVLGLILFLLRDGILSGSGSPKLDTTGFVLPIATSRTLQAPTGWSGRFWGRTGCNFDDSSSTTCSTGDCGSGEMECNGTGAEPPATLAEFTLGISGSLDFYDVSLVDGYNLPMIVEGSGSCITTGCISDLNKNCPTELKAKSGLACRSACEAFGTPEYCCSGAYGSPDTCKPSMYSQVFKSACPKSYSYAYDDATSTFTCSDADYTITFCPILSSLKSSREPPPPEETGDVSGSGTEPSTETQQPIEEASLANSYFADMAIGESTRNSASFVLLYVILLPVTLIFLLDQLIALVTVKQ
ncbi:Thaumatin-like protein 1 [Cardamine amara subsp. amara]|uniref:Thaumatin-like protein 1 n=1 Tax=Cardamine amara subsp. amara TaxID=228776 RepID=A0ABD1BFW1_CARAN